MSFNILLRSNPPSKRYRTVQHDGRENFQYPPRIEPRFNRTNNQESIASRSLSVSSSDRTSLQLRQHDHAAGVHLSFSILLGSNLASTTDMPAPAPRSRPFQYPPRIEPRFNPRSRCPRLPAAPLSVSSSDRTSLQHVLHTPHLLSTITYSIFLRTNRASTNGFHLLHHQTESFSYLSA